MELKQVSFPQMSFVGAVLIIAIIVIRALAINRLPKKTFLIMWGIAVLRLCIPFNISFDFSINAMPMKTLEVLKENVSNTAQNISQTLQIPQNQTIYPMEESMGKIIPVLWMIWVIGVSVCLLFFLVSYVKCMRRFATSFPVRNEFAEQWRKEHKIRRRIEIRESGVTNTPLTYGVLHPVILMPKKIDWNDEEKIAYILEHEFIHIKRMDLVMKSILILILSIHWFNPLVWIMYLLCNRDLELSCDEMVIFNFGIENRTEYAYMLIDMEESKGSFTPMCNYFSKNVMEERILSIMKTKKLSKAKVMSASILVAGVSILCIFSISVNAKDQHSGTALELSTAWEGASTEQSLSARIEESAMFPEYEKYGLSYDEGSGYLMYDNKTVGYFNDEFKKDTFCRLEQETGEIGLEVKRDANWDIIDMEAFPMSEVMDGEISEISITSNPDNASTAEERDIAAVEDSAVPGTYLEEAETDNEIRSTADTEYLEPGIDQMSYESDEVNITEENIEATERRADEWKESK